MARRAIVDTGTDISPKTPGNARRIGNDISLYISDNATRAPLDTGIDISPKTPGTPYGNDTGLSLARRAKSHTGNDISPKTLGNARRVGNDISPYSSGNATWAPTKQAMT